MWNVTNVTTNQGDDYTKGYLPHYQYFRKLEVFVSVDLRAAALVADAGI